MSDARKNLEKDGYHHARGVFSAAELVAMETDFDRVVQRLRALGEDSDGSWSGAAVEELRGNNDVITHTHNVQHYSAVWLRAIQQRRFLDIAQEILGGDVVLHHTKLFYKPAGKGSPFPIHQDYSYFPTIRDTMIAAVIHVSAATDEMGCLRVYPGSHTLGRLPATSGQTDSETLKNYPLEKATVVEAEAGDVLFLHYFTLHGSMPNRSPRPRKTVLVQLYAGDDRVEDGNDHPDEQLTLSGWNSHASRQSAGRARV